MTQKRRQPAYKRTTRYFIEGMTRNKRDFYLALINPIGAVGMNVGVPLFAGWALASTINNDGNFSTNMVYLGLSILLGIVANFLGFQALMRVQAKTMSYLSNKIYKRLLSRGVRYHINHIGGKLVSDANDFVTSAGDIMIVVFAPGASMIISLVLGLAVLYSQSWQLGLFVSVIVSSVILMAKRDMKVRTDARAKRLVAQKKAIAHYSDSIVNAITVKMFGAETRERQKYEKLNSELERLRLVDWQWAGRSGNIRMAYLLVCIFLLLLFINYTTQNNLSTLGTGIFAFTYTFSLLLRLFEINILTRRIEEAYLKSRPMTDMLDEELEVTDTSEARDLEVKEGAIEFKDVDFHYSDNGNQQVFKNFNLSIKAKEKIGIVGSSGSGKTTLTKILLRFDDIQNGSIEIDGQDIRSITQQSLHDNIGYVPQEPLLFHRSLEENIKYGRPQASTKEMIQASKMASADEFIQKLDAKYQTIVGERGIKLSGGQRQRVAISRMILKNAPLLVLDEATSALDSESEVLVQKALHNLIKDKTTIVIAHRLSTLREMDRIIVLDNGKTVEEGTHKVLLKKNGIYSRLWSHQSGGFLQED